MRKVLITLLLASAATSPAMAQSFQRPERGDRAERQSQRAEERADRAERADRVERAERAERDSRRDDRGERPNFAGRDRPTVDPTANNAAPSDAERAQRMEQLRQQWQHGQRDQVRNEVRDRVRDGRPAPIDPRNRDTGRPDRSNVRPDGSNVRNDAIREQMRERYQRIRDERRNAPPPIVSHTPRPNSQPPERYDSRRHGHNPRWNPGWRNDHRYDWRDWRRHNRWRFNFGFYNDPFGWGYQPYSIGWRMWPSYYGSRYWLNDPWQYRLPYAPPGTRWIRYFDDAILVDTWNGRVLDVINDFFW